MGGYFWAHKPFGIETVLILSEFSWPTDTSLGQILGAVGTAVAATAIWLIITLIGMAIGRTLFHKILADEHPATRLAIYAGVGLGTISVDMGVLGLIGGLYSWVAWAFVIILTMVLRKQITAVFHELRAIKFPQPTDALQKLTRTYGKIVLALTFITALAPTVAFDSLTYHLRAPRFFIEAGQFVHPVDIPHMGFPLLGQMQFTLAMLLGSDVAPALFHFGYGLMSIALVAALAKRAFGERAAWFSVMVLLSIPTFFTLMAWPYVDVTLMFYTTAVFYLFLKWRAARAQNPDSSISNLQTLIANPQSLWLILLGMMVGFSGGLKYTAIASPFAIAISIAWESRRDGPIEILKRLLLIGLTAVILVLPWLIENIITTGSPTYPFFFDGALYWDEWRAWWYDLPGTGLATTAPWLLPLVPLHATILGIDGTPSYEAPIGPFIFGALFLLPFVWRTFQKEEKTVLWHLLLFFTFNYILWLNGVARTALLLRARFIFMAFGITAVIGGLTLSRIEKLKHPELKIGWLAETLLRVIMIFLLISQIMSFVQINPLPVVLGFDSERNYRARRIGDAYLLAIDELNQLPEGSKIAFFWETRSLACDPHILCDPDPILDNFLHFTQHYQYDAAGIKNHLQANGFTHVLWANGGYEFLLSEEEPNPIFLLEASALDPIGHQITAKDEAVWQALSTDHLEQVAAWGDIYQLYELSE